MIHIRAYKGYNIEYDEFQKLFFGLTTTQSGLTHSNISGCENEQILINKIDRQEEEIAEQQKKEAAAQAMNELGGVVFTIAAPDLLYYCKVLQEYLNEATAHISSTQLWSCGMDAANCVLVKVEIPLTCSKPQLAEFRVGFVLNTLYSLIRNTKAKQFKLEFDIKKNTCTISDGFGSFTMHLLEPYEKPAKVPELSFISKAFLKAEVFNSFISYADRVAETVSFIAKDSLMHFEAAADLQAYISPTFGQVGKDAKSRFSIEYLMKLKFTGVLALELRTDYPLRITDEHGNFLILAPRVGED